VWWFIPVIPAIWEAEVGELWSKASPSKTMRFYLKNELKAKGLGVYVTQVVDHLPSKKNALSSIPSAAKNNE
jgi:hypothetical protein